MDTQQLIAPVEVAEEASVTTRGHTATRADVLNAITVCDELGQDEFLRRNGYRDSVRYHLRHNGRSYPSKAILGVALGLASDDFFGGARETVKFLGELGFHVRNSETGEVVDKLGLDAIRAQMIADGFHDPAPEWPTLPVTPSAYFASGSNRPAEISALGKVGADIGVAAPELSIAAECELHALRGSDVLVFVDSGAFSEVKFTDAGVEVVKPITEEKWQEVIDLYTRLASSLGSQLWVVAPDMVGNQEVTLQRLRRWATDLGKIQGMGARVLVPMQKGEFTQAEFAIRCDAALGFADWIPALPCKKAATTAAEVREFLAHRSFERHVHLLGLGIANRNIHDYVAPFAGSKTTVSLDSCWIAANVGRGKRPRRLTRARDIAERVLRRMGRFTKSLKVESAMYACWAPPAKEV